MNNKEIVCYLLGIIGDVTRDEAIEALKHYTDLREQEINQIIDALWIYYRKLKSCKASSKNISTVPLVFSLGVDL